MEKNYVPRQGWFTPHRGLNVLRIIGMTIIGVAFAALFALAFGFLVMVLWNWLMPALFGLKAITYWQAFGIVVLAKLLFAGFAPHRKDRSNHFHPRFFDRRSEYEGEKKEDDAMIEGWKHYKKYWREEGKAAFEDYLRRIKEQKEKESQE
jgi:hypothetical protein